MNSRPTRKLAFVSTMAGNPWGGCEALWSQTAMHLHKAGHSVVASTFDWSSRPAAIRELQEAGMKFLFRPLRKNVFGRFVEKVGCRLSGDPMDRRCMAWLRRESPDLLVISQGGPWEGLAWIKACRKLGIPYCPVIHANSEIWWPVDPILDDIQEGYPMARRLFFVSNENMRVMQLQVGFEFDNAEVVVNPRKVNANSDIAWPDDEVTRLACVGRIDPKAKGQDILLQLMAMPKWRKRPVELSFYGGGPCERGLSRLMDMLKLENVRFAGHVADVGKIWEENHALILPSRFEGLPMVIVEALYYGRPVITTRVAGNAEYIKDGVTGFVAEAPTLRLVDEALERAWERRVEWRAMGVAARADMKKVLPDDPIEVFANRLLELIP